MPRPAWRSFLRVFVVSVIFAVVVLAVLSIAGTKHVGHGTTLEVGQFKGRRTLESLEEFSPVWAQRRDLLNDVCKQNGIGSRGRAKQLGRIRKTLTHLIVDDNYKVLYCAVPKVASTNWKRIFLLISGKINMTDPSKIVASDVHAQALLQLNTLDKYSEPQIKHILNTYFKFMFVRNPFERILSAYKNKFTTHYNAYFPRRYGRYIVKHYRKSPDSKSLHEGKNVTFAEFIKYILDPHTKEFNEHWKHYYKLCHPCLVKYDFIGKYETLHRDVDYVLGRADIPESIHFQSSRPKTTRRQMAKAYKNTSAMDIHRLWKLYAVDFAMFGYEYPDFHSHT